MVVAHQPANERSRSDSRCCRHHDRSVQDTSPSKADAKRGGGLSMAARSMPAQSPTASRVLHATYSFPGALLPLGAGGMTSGTNRPHQGPIHTRLFQHFLPGRRRRACIIACSLSRILTPPRHGHSRTDVSRPTTTWCTTGTCDVSSSSSTIPPMVRYKQWAQQCPLVLESVHGPG